MSRSYKKNPKGRFRTFNNRMSDKDWKQDYNRKTRRYVNTKLASVHPDDMDDLILPARRIEYSDVWNSKADGSKHYFGHYNSERIEYDIYYRYNYEESVRLNITKDNIDLIFNRYTFSETIQTEMRRVVKEYGIYYHYYPVYILYKTYEEEVQEHKQWYAKCMRK